MYSWTSVMSQRGVEVAPQIPMLSFPSSHVGSISLMSETSRDWGLTCRHSPKSTRPLELFFPQTNRIRSCRRANSLILGMRLATCRQMVSNDSNCPSGFSCFISSTMWRLPSTYLVVWEYSISFLRRSIFSRPLSPSMTTALPWVCPTSPLTSACPVLP